MRKHWIDASICTPETILSTSRVAGQTIWNRDRKGNEIEPKSIESSRRIYWEAEHEQSRPNQKKKKRRKQSFVDCVCVCWRRTSGQRAPEVPSLTVGQVNSCTVQQIDVIVQINVLLAVQCIARRRFHYQIYPNRNFRFELSTHTHTHTYTQLVIRFLNTKTDSGVATKMCFFVAFEWIHQIIILFFFYYIVWN